MTPYQKKQLQELHQKLLWLRTTIGEGKNSPTWGICAHIQPSFVQWNQLESFWREWPKFSGDSQYPVPGANGELPHAAFREAYFSRTTWEGEYGALRLELLHFLIDRANSCLYN